MTLKTDPWGDTCVAEQDIELKLKPAKLSVMTIALDGITKKQRRELRLRLKEDLATLKSLSLKLEARELEVRRFLTVPEQVNISDAQLSEYDTKTPSDNANTPTPSDKDVNAQVYVSLPKLVQHGTVIAKQGSFRSNESTTSTIISGKRTPKANPLYSRAEFVVGKDKIPPSVKSKSKHGKKRKGSLKLNEVNRKQKLAGIPHEIRLQCKSVLSKLMSHKNGWIFNHPVDAVKLQLSDYHTIIKNPMDLGTVRSKLDRKQYLTPQEFADDVRLTFNNAMTYNPPSNEVHIMAEELLNLFEKGWEGVVEKLEKLETEAELERQKVQSLQAITADAALKSPAQKCRPKVQKRVMTVENKIELQKIMEQLPQKMLEGIINLMKEKNVSMCDKGDEIEVDLDSFDDDTLWKLDRHAKNCLKRLNRSKKKPPTKPQATSAPPLNNKTERDVPANISSSSDSSSSESSSSSDSDSGSSASSESDMDNI